MMLSLSTDKIKMMKTVRQPVCHGNLNVRCPVVCPVLLCFGDFTFGCVTLTVYTYTVYWTKLAGLHFRLLLADHIVLNVLPGGIRSFGLI